MPPGTELKASGEGIDNHPREGERKEEEEGGAEDRRESRIYK